MTFATLYAPKGTPKAAIDEQERLDPFALRLELSGHLEGDHAAGAKAAQTVGACRLDGWTTRTAASRSVAMASMLHGKASPSSPCGVTAKNG